METRHFQIGQIIFRTGEESREAYRILKGRVGISKIVNGCPMVLALMGEGDIFGEMSLVSDKPHSATAQAIEPTEVEVMTEDEFNKLILQDPEKIIPYLSNFFERLRTVMDSWVMEIQPKEESTAQATPAAELSIPFITAVSNEAQRWDVRLAADNIVTKKLSSSPEVTIEKFPYRLGREELPMKSNVFCNNDFTIRDLLPFQVSRNHCSIEREGDNFFIRDRGSRLGTIVNGKYLSIHTSTLKAKLKPGKNTLILDTNTSEIRYTVTLEAQENPEKARELEKLKARIDDALADGQLSRQELDDIRTAIYADKKVTAEEVGLVMSLMEKVTRGEIQLGD
ncbi:MAG: cyclic nucleotide-binding domain-containing protein [Xenococcaceae cyanobacterium]